MTTTLHPTPRTAAIIGCGKRSTGKVGWAQGHAHGHGLRQAFPDCRLIGVDPSPDNLAAFGEIFQLPPEQLFPSTDALYEALTPDLVSIATWPALHYPQVMEALERGTKRILCEKPLAVDNGQIDAMIAAAQKAGARIGVAHQRRYLPTFALLRELVQAGEAGAKPWFTGSVPGGWDMLSWIVHWFDIANFVFDGPPESILAGIDHSGERLYGHAVENAALIQALYPDDRQALFISGSANRFTVQVEGEKAALHLIDDGVLITGREGTRLVKPGEEEARFAGISDYACLYRDMNDALATGGDFRCDISHGAWATRMAFAAHESALSQRTVQLSLACKYAPLEVVQKNAEVAQSTSLRVTLLADPHHYYEQNAKRNARDGLASALESLGHTVRVVPVDERPITADDLEGADLLVIYHTQRKADESTRALIGGWIEGGRPTLISHCGIGAYDWADYRRWIGRHWCWHDEDAVNHSRHPHEPCTIHLDDQVSDWQAGWRKAWLPTDEVYTHLKESGAVEDLAWCELNGERQPWAWMSREAPRLGVLLPGHRPDIFDLPVLRSALNAMILRILR